MKEREGGKEGDGLREREEGRIEGGTEQRETRCQTVWEGQKILKEYIIK